MTEKNQSKKEPFFSASLPPAMLEEILQRIDENLYSRPLINNQTKPGTELNDYFNHLPLPTLPPSFLEKIVVIRNAQAPYYVVSGNPIAKFVKRIHNLVLKFFGRKQAYFNNLTLDLLEAMVMYISALHEHNKSQTVLTNALARQTTLQTEQFAALQTEYQQLIAQIEQLSTQQVEYQHLKTQVEQQVVKQSNNQHQLENVHEELKGLSAWLDLVARKTENASLDAREALAFQSQTMTGWPEPRIVDPQKFSQRLTEMKDQVKINLGCGEKPLPEYINVDFRQLPGVDIVADVHRLPFDLGTVFEISSAHLIEHFREHHSRTLLLPYWKSLLKTSGQLRIVCPNWEAMIEQLNSGTMSLDNFKRITFGAQDYEGDDHFAMYTPETLERLLLEAGFSRVDKLALNRMNGGCPEMELVAKV